MTDVPALLEHVTVRFGARVALDDVTMQVPPSTFVALIGPNAGGKTTLLRVLLGVVRPQQGTVRVFGDAPHTLGEGRTRIGYVPQASVVNNRFPVTARQVVTMGAIAQAGILRRLPADTADRVQALLTRVGLADEADRDFHILSGGQQQRAIIARALVPGPKFLLLDEPTVGIDTTGQTQVLELLRDLRGELGLSVLMVSHHIGEMMPYVDQVACLNRTLHWHDRAQLLNESVLREVYACELDAFFLQHHQHQAQFHGDEPEHGHDHASPHTHD